MVKRESAVESEEGRGCKPPKIRYVRNQRIFVKRSRLCRTPVEALLDWLEQYKR